MVSCSTRKKLPSIHSACVVMVHLPEGAPGAAVIVPSAIQSPANISSFLSSGAGLGGVICAYAEFAAMMPKVNKAVPINQRFIDILRSSNLHDGRRIGEYRRLVNRKDCKKSETWK